MNQFEISPPKPEFKPMTTEADVQQANGHIPALCQNLHNFQAFLDTTDPIPEEARWTIKTMVTEAKFGLASMTELIDRLIKENQVLSNQQHSESINLRQELDTERALNVQLQKITRQFTEKSSKDRRIAELEEEIAQAKRTAQQQSSQIVGYETSRQPLWTHHEPEKQLTGHHQSPATTSFHQQNGFGENEEQILGRIITKPHQTVKRLNNATQKSRPVSAQHAPVTPENRTNGQAPISEPIPMQLDTISQFATRQPEDIPAEDFIITSEEIERQDVGSKRLLLTNISSQHYGRVIGQGGQNAKRLEREYGVKIRFLDRQNNIENLKLMISEGDAESRRAASDDIIENLPVVVECPYLKSNGQALKNATYRYKVSINRTNGNMPGMTICGTLTNCQQAYKVLVNNEAIFYP
ncbi:hypothetical protein DAPPUDRAFT_325117 [Daphnia pulex]|uniref:K Homology domain-containing protein n=1 Tax=Daphnia pulex TaxID=6669 RepID=E9H3S1_DAPPU|nr:hypothetical protein DAPPUDRAFT_325117 [Daphnia pulex]|eukprot:EFX73568.1 hypothetical protein DAPPUDRAFT_325117 [Daphnia pulex]